MGLNQIDSDKQSGAYVGRVRLWLVHLFVQAIESCSTEQDRNSVIACLAIAREVLKDDLAITDKLTVLYRMVSLKGLAVGAFRSVSTAVKSYWRSDLPLAVKAAIPITLAASAVVGGQGAGIVALGSGIGVPVLLLVFLGSAGVTSILEAVLSKTEASSYLNVVLALIARDAAILQVQAWLRDAMQSEIVEPQSQPMPSDVDKLRARLYAMPPFDFERHIMGFFQQQGLLAWNTKKSNDGGVDGFAKHQQGLIVVQCKRYSADHLVDRPTVQQLKGVVEENSAWRGYLVTTSAFSKPAQECAALNEKIILVDLDRLIEWHQGKAVLAD